MTGPIRVDAEHGPWPLHGRVASQAIEAAALARHTDGALMRRAGLGAARLVLARWPSARRVLVLAGPGNNGGDGWVLAQRLHECGLAVEVCHVPGIKLGPPDACAAEAAARNSGVCAFGAEALHDALDRSDLVVDALLGLGSTGAPRGAVAAALAMLRQACESRPGRPLLALDLPSGFDIDTGQPWPGAEPVPADATLALLTLKPGLFTGLGRDMAGEVWFEDLNVAVSDREASSPSAWLSGQPDPAPERHAMHKGSRGDVWIVGGSLGMEGAAMLAADAASRGGAGRVWVRLLADHAGSVDARPAGAPTPASVVPRASHLLALPETAVHDPARLAAATVVAGCGGGAAMAAALPVLLAHAARLVLDADALNAIARTPALRAALIERGPRGQPTILTPHPLEAARLLGVDTGTVQADRLAAAQRLAETSGACVVLKGSGTVIAAPQRAPWINPSGNSALAIGGSGDVLAGWLGAAWAQAPQADPQAVAAAAVWRHGDAADRWRAAGHRGPLPAHELARWIAAGA